MVDPDTGKILPDGEPGELVYTGLDGRGTVVLRYRTGDLAKGGITREPCPVCGRSVPRISSDLGRASNQVDFALTKIKGALVNLNVLGDIMNADPSVDEWQLVIRKRNDDPFEVDEMVVTMSLTPGRDAERAEHDLGRKLFAALEVRPQFERLSREEILDRLGMETRLKENRFVDLRPENVVPSEAEDPNPALKG